MAQQTQIRRVVERFGPFMAAYPTPAALAAAPPERVIADWAGLGYLRRAHALRRAAAIVAAEGWPDDLTDLPGVGPYTAAAVGCFAFGRAVPTPDTNHRRVVSRWVGLPLSGADLTDAAADLLDSDHPAEWNQAIMDLGSAVCRPEPRCDACPVAVWCADPSVYEPPRRQSPYEGSLRQIRAAILKTLSAHPGATAATLAAETGHPSPRIEAALTALLTESAITRSAKGYRLL